MDLYVQKTVQWKSENGFLHPKICIIKCQKAEINVLKKRKTFVMSETSCLPYYGSSLNIKNE